MNHSTHDYCQSFREEACRVWHDMSEAEAFGIPRNEETTTETLLLNLAKKHHGRGLEIKAYTKKEESQTGADWAFWFSDPFGKGIGVRIQAKRYYATDKCYKSLYHQSKEQKTIMKTNALFY